MPGDTLGGFFLSAWAGGFPRDPWAITASNEAPALVRNRPDSELSTATALFTGQPTGSFADGPAIGHLGLSDITPSAAGSASTSAGGSPVAFTLQSDDSSTGAASDPFGDVLSGSTSGVGTASSGSGATPPFSTIPTPPATTPSSPGSTGASAGNASSGATTGSGSYARRLAGTSSGPLDVGPGTGLSSTRSSSLTPSASSSSSTKTGAGPLSGSSSITVYGTTLNLTEGVSNTNLLVATFSDSDGNPYASKYTATINWGDGQTSAGTVGGGGGGTKPIVPLVVGTFTVNGTHTYAEEGTYTITVTIKDADGATGSGMSTAKVADAALSAGNSVSIKVVAGDLFSGAVAYFNDADPTGAVSDYTATISWGDSTFSKGIVGLGGPGGSFTITGDHIFNLPGTYPINVTVTDLGGGTIVVNDPGTVTDSGQHLMASGTALNFTEGLSSTSQVVATFSDADGNPTTDYTATIDWGDGQTSTGTIAAGSLADQYQVTGAHTYGEEGPFTVIVTISDLDGTNAAATASSTAYVVDAALTAQSGSNLTTTAGAIFSGVVAAFSDADPAGTVGDYTALIDWGDNTTPMEGTVSGTGPFNVTGSHAYQQTGAFTITTTVLDAGGARVAVTRTITVNAAALTMHGASFSMVEGASGSATVATFTDPDGNTNAGLYTATIAWGDGSSSSGTVTTGFSVTGTHTYSEEGAYAVSVTVTDSDGSSASSQSTATVTDASLSVTANTINAKQAVPFEATVASFTDADPGGTASDYTAFISWGDGSATTTGNIASNGSSFLVDAGHEYASTGNFTVTVTVDDAGGATATGTATATVTAANASVTANNLTVTEGQPFSGAVGTLVPGTPDPGAGAFTVDVGWGDGGESSGTLTSNGNGGYTISGSHTYPEETGPSDPYTLVISVYSTSTGWLEATGAVTVADANLSPTGVTLTGWANAPTGEIAVGKFTDGNPQGSVSDFTASINWGDGNTSSGTIQSAGTATYEVLGNHTYTAAGQYSIIATVTDDGGQTTTINSTINISAATASLTATEFTPFSGVVATFNGNPAQATSATINWGDGNSSAGTITSTGSNSFTVSGNHTYGDETNDVTIGGPYTLKVTVQMSGGGTLTEQGPATVNDATITAQGSVALNGTVGVPIATPASQVVVANFIDANPQASLADFTATIDWGDGDTDAGTVQLTSGVFQVLGNHTYADAGVYRVTIKLVDDGGSTGTAYATATIGEPEDVPYSLDVQITLPSGSTDTDATDYAATVAWGDGRTSAASVEVIPSTSSIQLEVTAYHVYYEEGTFTPYVTVTDASGATYSAYGNAVTVEDAPLYGYGEELTVTQGEPTGAVVLGSFLDDNPQAANFDFNPANPSLDYTVASDWGITTVVDVTSDTFTVLGSSSIFNTPGTYTLHTTVEDDGGESCTFTTIVTVIPSWTVIGTATASRSNDPDRAFLLPIGEATVDLNQGALRLNQTLDFDQSPGTSVGGNPALVYNSATVDVRPVIQLEVQTDENSATPTQAQITLTWNGVAQSPVTVPIINFTPGGALNLAVEDATPVSTSGVYNWSVAIVLTLADNTTRNASTSGTAYVVARDGSPYGAGWGIDGIPQLLVGPAGVLWETGAGDSRFFSGTPGSQFPFAYTSPAEDFGMLVQNSDHSFSYTAKDKIQWNFNSAGQLTSVVDTHGLARTYSYDTQGRLSSINAIDGGATTLSYDPSSGLATTITEPGNRSVQLQHDAYGNLTQITDVDSTTRTMGYDGYHHLTNDQWSPLNASFGYDSTTGLLNDVNLGLGSNYAITPADARGLSNPTNQPDWAAVTDGNNHTKQFLLDERGRLLEQVLADGATSSYERDNAGQVTRAVDPLGLPTFYAYAYGASDGDLTAITYADGATDSFQYDPTFHHVTETINAYGIVTSYNTYDPSTGDLLSSRDALGNTTSYVWSNGLLQHVTDPRLHTSYFYYDSARRQDLAFDNMEVPTFTYYDADGNPSATEDALGRFTFTTYSPRNLLLKTIDANFGVTSDTYNAYGQQTTETNARGYTSSTTYDQRGWATLKTDFAGAPTYYTYDAAGNVTLMRDADLHPTSYGYDRDDRQTSVSDALTDTATTAYDADGNVTSTTDALKHTTDFFYDVRNRQVLTIDPMLRTMETVYDGLGNVIDSIDAEGLNTLTDYDRDNRPIATSRQTGPTTFETSRTVYDGNGNVVETIDPAGLATFMFYDANNRPVETLDPQLLTTWTGYDAVGNADESVDGRGKLTKTVYDLLNQPTVTIDPDGNSNWTIRDAVGNVVETIDGRQHAAYTIFDADNRAIVHKDENGKLSGASFDAVGNEISSFDNNGKTTDNWFDTLNRQYLSLDPDRQIALTGYNAVGDETIHVDGAGDLTLDAFDKDDEESGTRDGNGKVTQDYYTPDGQLALVLDPDLDPTGYLYDGAGNQIAVVDSLGLANLSLFNADNDPYLEIDPLGQQTALLYDHDNRVIQQTLLNKSNQVIDVEQMAYDGDGNVTQSVDGDGNTTVTTYDNAGFKLLEQVFAPGASTPTTSLSYLYDSNGNVTRATDGDGNYTVYSYDNDNRVVQEQFYAANGTLLSSDTTQFDGNGNPTQITDGVGNVSKDTYNGENQVLTEQVFAPGASLPTSTSADSYDGAGRLAQAVDGDGNYRNYTYDGDGRQLTQKLYSPTNALIASTSDTYDPAGFLTQSTDANGNTTAYVYNADGWQLSVTVGSGTAAAATTYYGYDFDGQVAFIVDPDLNATSYTRDAEGNVLTTTDNFGYTDTRTYDANGNLTSEVNRNGLKRTMTYNADNQLLTEKWYASDGVTVIKTKSFSYDSAGNMLSAGDNTGTYSFTYDGENRLKTQTDPNGVTLTLGYDGDNNVTSVADSLGGTVTSYFDALGNLTSRRLSGSTQARFDMTYDANSNLLSVSRYADAAGTQLKGTSALTYDAENNLTSLVHKNASNTILANYSYSYDPGARLTSETDNGTTTNYTYDSTNQITASGSTSYAWDPNGNTKTSGVIIGQNNQLLFDATWKYTYDKEGNLTQKVGVSNGLTWTYGYDNANQMTSAVQKNSSGTTLISATYTYDVFGNRIASSVTQSGTTTVTHYAYLNGQLWADLTSSNALQTRYLAGAGADQWLARVDSTGTYWLLPDHLGSIRDVMNSSGTVIDHINYDAFGAITSETSSSNGGRLKYAGYEWDSALSVYHAGARYYDPASHRWMKEDPIGFDGGDSNLDRYVGNGPTNGTDPSGNYVVAKDKGTAQQWAEDLKNRGIAAVPKQLDSGTYFLYVPPDSQQKVNETINGTDNFDKLLVSVLLSDKQYALAGTYTDVNGATRYTLDPKVTLTRPELQQMKDWWNNLDDLGEQCGAPPIKGTAEYAKSRPPTGDQIVDAYGGNAAWALFGVFNGCASEKELIKKAQDKAARVAQVNGAASGVVGVVEAAAGIAVSCLPPPFDLPGPFIAAHGFDRAQAGFRQAWSGDKTNSFTKEAVAGIALTVKPDASVEGALKIGETVDDGATELGLMYAMSVLGLPRQGAKGEVGVGKTAPRTGNPAAPRPVVESRLPGRVTSELPEGQFRTPAELEQARNFYKRNIEEARQWYTQRTGKPWPENPDNPGTLQWAEHPRALKNGGDPLRIEPGVGPDPNAPHQVIGPDGLTDSQRFGRMGGRPKKNP